MPDFSAVARRLFANSYLLLIFATLCWAGNAVISKMLVGHASPMVVTTLRWMIVAAVLPLVAGPRIWHQAAMLSPHWKKLFLMGAFGFTGFNALFYAAAHRTSAVNIGILQGFVPAMVLAGSVVLFGARLRLLQVAGLVVTLVGVMVVASRGDIAVLRDLAFNLGDVWMLIADVFYAGYTLALRNRPRAPGLAIFAAFALAAALSSLPLLAAEILAGQAIWPTPEGWVLLLYIALFASLASQLSYMRAVELIGPGRAGIFMNLIPVFASVLAVLVLGEHFGLYHAVALALVLGGLWLSERRPRAAPP